MKKVNNVDKNSCLCPYCEKELSQTKIPFCKSCGVLVIHCPHCKTEIKDKEASKCPSCGCSIC